MVMINLFSSCETRKKTAKILPQLASGTTMNQPQLVTNNAIR